MCPPLGYDAHPDPNTRSLVINEAERSTVERLFALYEALGCLRAVKQQADRLGLRSKRHSFSTGRVQGGGKLSRGQIHYILCNPIYAGRIRHKDKVFDGLHPAIIDDALWDCVQVRLQAASARPRTNGKSVDHQHGANVASPLKGKFRDATGDRLTPSHTQKGRARIRYYVSNRLLSGAKDPSGWRLPAAAFESSVANAVANHLEQAARRHALLEHPEVRAGEDHVDLGQALAARLRTRDAGTLSDLVREGHLDRGRITIHLNSAMLANVLDIDPSALAREALTCTVPFDLRRRGVETKIIVGDAFCGPDHVLLRGLAKGHKWAAELQSGTPISVIAKRERVTEAYIRPRAQLAYLTPRIQTAILDGSLPPELTLEALVRARLPLDWRVQERMLGFESARPGAA